jgi:hypothetical protein
MFMLADDAPFNLAVLVFMLQYPPKATAALSGYKHD